MIRCTSDARAHAAIDQPATTHDAADTDRHRRLVRFVRDLGYPAGVSDAVITRLRRERGAMTAHEAGIRIADWITLVRDADGVQNEHPLPVAEAVAAFVVSGAAMWDVDVLFADPSALSPAYRAALSGGSGRVVPAERPLVMMAQSLDGPRWARRRRMEPTIRRLSWMPTR